MNARRTERNGIGTEGDGEGVAPAKEPVGEISAARDPVNTR